MKIFTTAFKNNEKIPSKFTCDGENVNPLTKRESASLTLGSNNSRFGAGVNPEIFIEDVPEKAKSLVLIVNDPDSPSGNWSHWIVWNIDPSIKTIKENSSPEGAVSGLNDFGERGYGGPCPFKGEHRYFFKLFALSSILNISNTSKKADLERAMEGLILEKSEFIGRYSRMQ